MACSTMTRPGQSFVERSNQVKAALERLKRYLQTGSVRVTIAPNGALSFGGWQDRDDVSDVCAYRTLSAEGSWELRQAVMRAEAAQGRKVNPNAVAAGWHSHDGGTTWGRH